MLPEGMVKVNERAEAAEHAMSEELDRVIVRA
jgi:hypothetical protein